MDDSILAGRIRAMLADRSPTEKRMFGGTCFMLNGNMVAGTLKGELLARTGKDGFAAAMAAGNARPMEMAGRVSEGFVIIADKGTRGDRELRAWLDRALAFVDTLPPKDAEPAKRRK